MAADPFSRMRNSAQDTGSWQIVLEENIDADSLLRAEGINPSDRAFNTRMALRTSCPQS
jgi:hypothetical protein